MALESTNQKHFLLYMTPAHYLTRNSTEENKLFIVAMTL